jgi:hypothetical protein
VGGRTARRGRAARRLLIDLTPVRRSRDLRCLVLGELISVFGTQLTTVAVPYQVYQLTHSSLPWRPGSAPWITPGAPPSCRTWYAGPSWRA